MNKQLFHFPFFGFYLLAVLTIAGCLSQSAQAVQQISITIDNKAQLERLVVTGLDVEWSEPDAKAFVILYTPADSTVLAMTGLAYEVVHADLEAFWASRLPPGRDDMGGYRTLDEMVEEMNQLHEDFPDIVGEPISIGRSYEWRDMVAVKISDNPDEEEDEPEVFFNALTHAHEVVGGELLFALMHLLTDEYGNDDRITRLVDERQTWFLPCVNVDGYAYLERVAPDGGGGWRKNRRVNADGSIGVDLNRNYGYQWGFDDQGSNPNPRMPTYRGSGPLSEPETAAIANFVNSHNFRTALHVHSVSNILMHPFAYDEVNPEDRDLEIFRRLGSRMLVDNHYRFGAVWDVYTLCNGEVNDWSYAGEGHDPIYSFLLEIGTQEIGHWAPRNIVPDLVAKNIETCLTLIEFADEPARVLPPEPPQNLSADIDWRGRTVLKWEPPEDEINPPVTYQIDRRSGEGDWENCGQNYDSTAWISEPFRDKELVSYRVRSFDTEGDTSDWSEECRVILPVYEDRLVMPLRRGWNLVSLNIGLPQNYWVREDGYALDSLFANFIDGEMPVVNLVKDRRGRFWIPGVIQDIPEWKPLEGYWILAALDTAIELSGTRIPSTEGIPLTAGWNVVSFLPEGEMVVEAPEFWAIRSILGHVEVLKEGFGGFALPQLEYSGVMTMQQGRGYWIRVNADCMLRYWDD